MAQGVAYATVHAEHLLNVPARGSVVLPVIGGTERWVSLPGEDAAFQTVDERRELIGRTLRGLRAL